MSALYDQVWKLVDPRMGRASEAHALTDELVALIEERERATHDEAVKRAAQWECDCIPAGWGLTCPK